MERTWFIYVLSLSGDDFYVGRTWNCKRRKHQHQARFGKDFEMRVVESGTGKEECKTAEIRWIEKLLAEGVKLENRMIASQGCWRSGPSTMTKLRESSRSLWQDPEYRRKQSAGFKLLMEDPQFRESKRISAKKTWREHPDLRAKMLPIISRLGKRLRTPEQNAALSAKTKGKRKNWSEEGEQRVRTTQFKQGEGRFADLPKELQEKLIAGRKKQWEGISKEERARMSTERNLAAWAKRTPEQRKAIGDHIREGKLKRFSVEELNARALRASMKASEVWANRSPHEKDEIIARRNATKEANLERKSKAI